MHLAFLVLPLLALVGNTAMVRLKAASRQETVVERLIEGAQQIALLNALDSNARQENAMAQINIAIRSLKIPNELATQLLGFDAQEALVALRARTDTSIVALGERANELQARFATLRVQTDAMPDLLDPPMKALLSELRADTEAELLRTEDLARQVVLSGQLVMDVRDLRLAALVVRSSLDEAGQIADLSVNFTKVDQGTLLRDYFVDSGLFNDAMTQLMNVDSKLGERATAMFNSPEFRKVDEFGAAQLKRRMEDNSNIDPSVVAPFIALSAERSDTVLELVDIAVEQLDSTVETIRSRSETDLRRELALLIAALFIGIVGTVLVAYRIVRPLRMLRSQSLRLINGDAVVPVRVGGPSEVAVSVRAFNELVQSVQLIETQAAALANGDLDHPCLAIHAPGRIGESMQAGVGRLKRSIAEERTLRNELRHDASHDRLTGVLNRSGMFDEIRRRLSSQPRQVSSLVFIDLDGFKAVNDQLGHGAGDKVLCEVARRLETTTGQDHVVARLGGDEFVVATSAATSLDEAIALSNAIIEAIAAPIDLCGQGSVSLSASAGIASVDEADDVSGLLYAADLAVYRAKAAGRARVEVFDEALRTEISDGLRVEKEVREALATQAITRHVQPVVDAHTGRMVGCEALLRWQRPDGSFVAPNDFLPTAEQSQLIVDIDLAGVAWACDQLALWRQHDSLRDVRLAINLSARTAQYWDLVRVFEREISRSGIDPNRLAIEITETLFVDDMRSMRSNIAALSALGIVTAIDDFGTGHTSIHQLLSFEADAIKIDRSLSKEACSEQGAQILSAVIALAHAAGSSVVAEGIETPDVARALHELGVDYFQGFLIARPMSVDALLLWVTEIESGDVRLGEQWLGVGQTSLKA
jgi:diguanylate cyclase (GGDEF)-like protein